MKHAYLWGLMGLVLGCGGSSHPAKQPVSIPASLMCTAPPTAVEEPADKAQLPDRKPAERGQESDELHKARLLESEEKCREALPLLARVMQDTSKEQTWNRQTAEYYSAVCAFRTGEADKALEGFIKIAGDRNHAKNAETVVWLLRVTARKPETVQLEWFKAYDEADIVHLDNPNQKVLFNQLAFYLGRRFYNEGQLNRAMSLFSMVAENSDYHQPSGQCLSQISSAKSSTWSARRKEQQGK